jgi:hypothetical protein
MCEESIGDMVACRGIVGVGSCCEGGRAVDWVGIEGI